MNKEVLEVKCIGVQLLFNTARKMIVHSVSGNICFSMYRIKFSRRVSSLLFRRTIIFRVITDARLGKYFVPLQPVADSVEEVNILSYRVV